MGKKYYFSLLAAVFACLFIAIVNYVNLASDRENITTTETMYQFEYVAGAIQPIPHTITIDKDWMILGKALFHSPLLSKDNTISCASCHMVDYGGDDGFPVSLGVDSAPGTRNSPTVLNATFNFRQFWDGRVNSLADQVSGPLHNPVEMATNWNEVINKLTQEPYFFDTFKQLSDEGITANNIIKAITTYEESLITPGADIDKYLLGDMSALTKQQIRGLGIFNEYGCSSCHQGINIGGNIYQKLGRLDRVPEDLRGDLGRYKVTKQESDRYVFKVPTLRNIADTAPYFHNGSVKTLPEAVKIMAKTQLARELSAKDVEDIVALLHAFSAEPIDVNDHE